MAGRPYNVGMTTVADFLLQLTVQFTSPVVTQVAVLAGLAELKMMALLLLAAAVGLIGLLLTFACFLCWRRYNSLHRRTRRESPVETPDAWEVAGKRLMEKMDAEEKEE